MNAPSATCKYFPNISCYLHRFSMMIMATEKTFKSIASQFILNNYTFL